MSKTAVALSRVTLAGSAVFSAALWVAHLVLKSDLALAQAADSLVDFAGAFVLAYAAEVGSRPRDEDHPFGHTRAESLGALGIAALGTLLAFEVGSSAVESLLGGSSVRPTSALLGLFLGKVAFKAFIFSRARRGAGAAFEALAVDAKNDMLVGAVAVVGFFGARFGAETIDAWLSLPVALYIGFAGFSLGRENVERLMGKAPPESRQEELRQKALAVSGIGGVSELRAHYLGTMLSIHVQVLVSGDLTLHEAHDIGERVREALEAEDDVLHCSVHLDPQPDGPQG